MIERAKGTKEVNPEEKIVRDQVIKTLTRMFELYGFYPIETPILQRLDILSSKYAGGAEILKETFKLKDQGNRELALRYDLTVPLAVYTALNPNIKMPFKRYEIGKVFRDGPVSKERFREFWQCDVDIVGTDSAESDAEILNLTARVFKELGLSVNIKINSKKILDGVIKYSGIEKEKTSEVILTIDKLDKIGEEGVKKELREKQVEEEQIEKLMQIILVKGSNKDKLTRLKDLIEGNEGIKDIEELLLYEPNLTLEISLARGMEYYTGNIFEVELNDSRFKTSFASGGRYDKMIGDFLGSKTRIPAMGISFGLNRIALALKSDIKTNTKVFVIPIQEKEEALKLANKLRDAGINIDVDLMSRNITKNLNYANSLKIPFVIFIGEEEIQKKKYKLRDMKTGKEQLLSLDEIIKELI